MARKKSVFFRTFPMPFRLAKIQHYLLIFSLIACTIVIPPVLSQIPTSQQLVEQGKRYYNAGRYFEAVKYLQQALPIFKDSNDELKLAIALSNLSLGYQQLGNWDQAQKHIEASLQILGYRKKYLKVYAQSLDIQGRLWYLRGKPEVALKSLQQATDIYQQLGDEEGRIGSVINQAQAMLALGFYQQTFEMLARLQQALDKIPDSAIRAKGFLSLGNVLRTIGELKQSQAALQKSLAVVEQLPSPQAKAEIKSAVLLSLGNTSRAQGNLERDRTFTTEYNSIPWRCAERRFPSKALSFYKNAAIEYSRIISAPPSAEGLAQINYLSLLVETEQLSEAQALWREIHLSELPGGRQGVYARINLAKSLACLQQKNTSISPPLWQEIDNLLETAIQNARELQDQRALSYALGNRGGLYEYFAWMGESQHKSQEYLYLETSQKLTQQALLIAQPIAAPDMAYQWEWQLGRLFSMQEKKDDAVAFYKAAVESLKSVRSDLLAINSDVQFSYRDNVEPVYRGLVDLLLRSQENSQPSQQAQAQAIENIDALQLAELQNFLRCNLTQIVPIKREIDTIDPSAVFIYPIILDNRLEVIFKLPGKHLRYVHPIPRTALQDTVLQLRRAIYTRNASKIRTKSQDIYRWLVKPIEPYLNEHHDIKTLVFVLDGELRNIPMAVLYDEANDQYLIQKDYALALLPSSQLFDLRTPQEQLKILAGGVSEQQENVENRNFSPLNIDELQQIAKILPSKLLINSQFTQANLHKQLQSGAFSILHFVTHGNFSSDPEDTYLLAYQHLMKAGELNNLLRNDRDRSIAIELLVLSACKTAEGDHRAILGLAGLAVRAGANSTLSTLWQINDNSTTQLMVQFYSELKKGRVTKAEALHRAQKALLAKPEYQNPYFWAPYILVGNWR